MLGSNSVGENLLIVVEPVDKQGLKYVRLMHMMFLLRDQVTD